jgi:alpha-tubulin suppressor-like RCC1 family protein
MAVEEFLMNTHFTALSITTGQRWVALHNDNGEGGQGTVDNGNADNDGEISDDFLQLGDLETWQNTESPMQQPDNRMVVNSEGKLYAWGRNNSGCLGLGDTTQRTSPVQVGTDTDWQEAANTGGCCVAIKVDGTLWTWGDNSAGQLGTGNTTARQSPAQVGSDTDWAHGLPTGINHDFQVAMKNDGGIYYSGSGTGGLSTVSSFTQIGSEEGFKDAIMIGTGVVAFK